VSFFHKFSLNRFRGAKILDPEVERMEQVFQMPSFTPEVVAAVSLITTQLPFRADESSRLLAQMEANAMSQREYEAMLPLFSQMPKPRRVLEVGPGFGRSVVYFAKKSVWDEQAEIHLYDTDGKETKYKTKYYSCPPQWPDVSSFCGSLSLLRSCLDSNQITNYSIFDAAKLPLREMHGPYDLIYGFFSLGFHWSLDFYLDDLKPLMGERSVLVCTLHKNFEPFARLKNYSTRVLYCRRTKKNAPPLRLLALSKSELPQVGVSLEEAFPGHN
jgi:hypothetical protein